MRIWLKNTEGSSIGRVDARDDVFGAPSNRALVHQVVIGHLANLRQGTAQTKTRAEVSGGGRKPRPQKGTGQARAGSTRSPIWVGGGTTFGPRTRSYRQRTPKRMRRLALVTVLSEKVRNGDLVIVDNLELVENKTKHLVEVLRNLQVDAPALIVLDEMNSSVVKAVRNIGRIRTLPISLLNTLDLVNCGKIVMTVDAVRKAEKIWGGVRNKSRRSSSSVAA